MPDLAPIDTDELLNALIKRGQGRTSGAIRLTKEQEDAAIIRVLRDYQDAVSNHQLFRQNHEIFLKSWRSISEKKTFPFEGASNIHVPFTSASIEQMKARLLRGLLGEPGNPAGLFSARGENVSPETIDELNEWFQYELDEVVCIRPKMRDILHQLNIDGFSTPIAHYDHYERDICYELEFPLFDEAPLDQQILTLVNLAVFDGQQVQILNQDSTGVFDVAVTGHDREVRDATLTFSIDKGSIWVEVETSEVVFDGVDVDIPDTQDIVVINSAPEIPRLPFFGARSWISTLEFQEGNESGKYKEFGYRKFDDDALTKIIMSGTVKQSEFVPQLTTELLDAVEGTQSKDPAAQYSNTARAYLEVYRWEGKLPIGPRQANVGVVLWMVPRARRVIRIMRLDELNRRGERTPIKFEFIRQPHRFYPIGNVEWLRHVQAELDAIHNQRLDSGLISMVPFFFYTPTAGFDKQVLTLEPGKGYPVRDPNSVTFPRIPWSPAWSFNEEGLVKRYAQEQAGLSEAAMGSFISKRASATEWSGTSESLDLRTDLLMEGMQESLQQLLWRVFELYRMHMPDGRVYQVSNAAGDRIMKRLRRDRLQAEVALHLTANSQQIAAQLSRDVAVNMLSLLMNPLLFQMAIVKPDTVFKALEKVIKVMGYKGIPIHKPDMPPDSDPPDVEHKRMAMGEPVAPSMGENFQEHLTIHAQFASRPDIQQLMPPEALQALAAHIQQTQKMAAVVTAMRAQQAAMAEQMQANMAAQGVNPTGAGSSQVGAGARPASQDEGVPNANPESMQGMIQ